MVSLGHQLFVASITRMADESMLVQTKCCTTARTREICFLTGWVCHKLEVSYLNSSGSWLVAVDKLLESEAVDKKENCDWLENIRKQILKLRGHTTDHLKMLALIQSGFILI